jgi:hypothetical protein
MVSKRSDVVLVGQTHGLTAAHINSSRASYWIIWGFCEINLAWIMKTLHRVWQKSLRCYSKYCGKQSLGNCEDGCVEGKYEVLRHLNAHFYSKLSLCMEQLAETKHMINYSTIQWHISEYHFRCLLQILITLNLLAVTYIFSHCRHVCNI